jgi:dolichyldiphosphatase
MDEANMRYLELTSVRFQEGDIVGQSLALISVVPIFIMAQYVALIAFRRDWQTICFFAGQLLNECLNLCLKVSIRAPRPAGCELSSYGMPSSHSQFMTFLATSIALYLLRRTRCPLWEKLVIISGAGSLAAAVSLSRVYLRYHTSDQVAAGAILGVVAGAAWFVVYQQALEPLGPRLMRSFLGRTFKLCDFSTIFNVSDFQHQSLLASQKQKPS